MAFFGVDLQELEQSYQEEPSHDELSTSTFIKPRKRFYLETTAVEPGIEESKKRKLDVPSFNIKTIEETGCLHQVVYKLDSTLPPLVIPKGEPAKSYPFTLDSFQHQAVLCIENRQSVLVSAHTSAGKTVVAEYAIAVGLRNRQRVIYTTPIKALSNQKFREFTEEFKDVGLMTGDITINPDASVIIMTTEILRSMLYRGSDVTREIGWVIFDEVHYMREKERGVVWEETIILIPDAVPMIFLSATIPNAQQFAEWVVHLHSRPCNVVYTDYRPTPLQHYVYPCGGTGIHLVVNQQREFIEANFNEALEILRKSGDAAQNDTKLLGRKGGTKMAMTHSSKLIKLVMDQELDPLIVFSFSKRECEMHANHQKTMDYTDSREKAAIELIFQNAISSLSKEDQMLPQVDQMLSLVKRGIGVHHGGLLPILKEIVEILFGEGYIKILCATETFAMGLNMPARTVLFTSTTKFDGVASRLVTAGEYIQMSGRAGRRGKDDRGTVILMLDDRISSQAAKNLLCGSADALNSAFYLTYTMVLNLMLVEDLHPESMLERSFFQFQNYRRLPDLERQAQQLQQQLDSMLPPLEGFSQLDQLANYVDLQDAIDQLEKTKWSVVVRNQHVQKFLQPGRVFRLERPQDHADFGWAICLGVRTASLTSGDSMLIVECLVRVAAMKSEQKELTRNLAPQGSAAAQSCQLQMCDPWLDDGVEEPTEDCVPWTCKVCQIGLVSITGISGVCLHVDQMIDQAKTPVGQHQSKKQAKLNTQERAGRLRREPHQTRVHIWQGIERAQIKLGTGELPPLDPIEDMKLKDKQVIDSSEKINMFRERQKTNPLVTQLTDCQLASLVDFYVVKSRKCEELDHALDRVRNCESLLQMDELRARKRVLRRLGFCTDPDDSITLKGRIACEISTGHELMLTELLLDGVFSPLNAQQCAAVLSAFVCDASEAKGSKVPLKRDLQLVLDQIKDKARFIARVAAECRVGNANFQSQLKFNQSNASFVKEDSSFVSEPSSASKGRRPRKSLLEENPFQSPEPVRASIGRITAPDVDENGYADKFSGELMEVVRAWAGGRSFLLCTEMTSVFDGTIIRVMRRLEELLRQMHCAAKVAGDSDLENKFASAIVLIKRDIIFAASLYL